MRFSIRQWLFVTAVFAFFNRPILAVLSCLDWRPAIYVMGPFLWLFHCERFIPDSPLSLPCESSVQGFAYLLSMAIGILFDIFLIILIARLVRLGYKYSFCR